VGGGVGGGGGGVGCGGGGWGGGGGGGGLGKESAFKGGTQSFLRKISTKCKRFKSGGWLLGKKGEGEGEFATA